MGISLSSSPSTTPVARGPNGGAEGAGGSRPSPSTTPVARGLEGGAAGAGASRPSPLSSLSTTPVARGLEGGSRGGGRLLPSSSSSPSPMPVTCGPERRTAKVGGSSPLLTPSSAPVACSPEGRTAGQGLLLLSSSSTTPVAWAPPWAREWRPGGGGAGVRPSVFPRRSIASSRPWRGGRGGRGFGGGGRGGNSCVLVCSYLLVCLLAFPR